MRLRSATAVDAWVTKDVAASAHPTRLAHTLPGRPLDAKHHVLVHYKLRRDLHTQLLAIRC